MPELPQNAGLAELQTYVRELEAERGFDEQTVLEKCLMLGEEVGELFKAIRKHEGIKTDPRSAVGDLEGELADVFIFLCSIANRYDIDMEQAFLNKEAINKHRTWR